MKKRDVSKILFLALSATLTFASFRADAGTCMNGSFACGALTAGEVYTFDSSVYLPRGSAFTNSWSFSLANPTPLLLGVVRNAGFRIGGNNFGGVGDLDVKLYQGSTVMPVDEGGSGRNRTFESYFSLAPGSYSLVVSGIVRSDSGPGCASNCHPTMSVMTAWSNASNDELRSSFASVTLPAGETQ